jgi:hypothetical protein
VNGDHCQDVSQLGASIRVEHQVFAQATSLHHFSTCEAEEGIIGLAFTMISSHNYPSLLSNLMRESELGDSPVLMHSIYSLYLNAHDNYPDQANGGNYSQTDAYENLEYGGARPTSAKSQIAFGAVDQQHYKGCLQWHDLVMRYLPILRHCF